MRRTFLMAAFVSTVLLACSSSSHAQVSSTGPTGGNTAVTSRVEADAPSSLTPSILRQQLRSATAAPSGVPMISRRNLSLLSLVPMLSVLWRRGLL